MELKCHWKVSAIQWLKCSLKVIEMSLSFKWKVRFRPVQTVDVLNPFPKPSIIQHQIQELSFIAIPNWNIHSRLQFVTEYC